MVNIIAISFDRRTKIIMAISVVIAVCIMSYNFYNIIIKEEDTENKGMEEIENILELEANYNIEIHSNKTINSYDVNEEMNYLKNYDRFELEDFIIEKNGMETNIKYKSDLNEKNTVYIVDESINNYCSLGEILKLYKNIKSKNIDGKIEVIKKDNNVSFMLSFENKSIFSIEIIIENNMINKVYVYSKENEIMYYIKVNDFKVKKTN